MKILIVNPNSSEQTDAMLRRRIGQLGKEQNEFQVIHLQSTPELICTAKDVANAAAEAESLLKKAENGYDGFILACHSDPGLKRLREVLKKPIVGIGEASYWEARQYGKKTGILTPSIASVERKQAAAREYGCESLLTGIEVVPEEAYESLLSGANRLIDDFGAEAIILGCANYCCEKERLENRLGRKIFDGVEAAVVVMETLWSRRA